MRASTILLGLTSLLTLTSAQDTAATQQAPLTPPSKTFKISLWTQPLHPHPDLPHHEKWAKIIYTIPSLNHTISSYDIPSFLDPSSSAPGAGSALSGSDIVKLGFYSGRIGDEDTWHGIISTAEQFGADREKTVKLFLDDTGKVWHVGFSSTPKAKTAAGEKKNNKKGSKIGAQEEQRGGDVLGVKVIPLNKGEGPTLNKPVVVSKDGKTEAEGEVEKTFLQKYWWAIGLFLLVQIFMGGGGDK